MRASKVYDVDGTGLIEATFRPLLEEAGALCDGVPVPVSSSLRGRKRASGDGQPAETVARIEAPEQTIETQREREGVEASDTCTSTSIDTIDRISFVRREEKKAA